MGEGRAGSGAAAIEKLARERLGFEQLANAETRQALQRARPGLFAVDEAHLISQWGHDFPARGSRRPPLSGWPISAR